jgi:hypothetical protein
MPEVLAAVVPWAETVAPLQREHPMVELQVEIPVVRVSVVVVPQPVVVVVQAKVALTELVQRVVPEVTE